MNIEDIKFRNFAMAEAWLSSGNNFDWTFDWKVDGLSTSLYRHVISLGKELLSTLSFPTHVFKWVLVTNVDPYRDLILECWG